MRRTVHQAASFSVRRSDYDQVSDLQREPGRRPSGAYRLLQLSLCGPTIAKIAAACQLLLATDNVATLVLAVPVDLKVQPAEKLELIDRGHTESIAHVGYLGSPSGTESAWRSHS